MGVGAMPPQIGMQSHGKEGRGKSSDPAQESVQSHDMGLLLFDDTAEKVFAVGKGRVGSDFCVKQDAVLFRLQSKPKDLPGMGTL